MLPMHLVHGSIETAVSVELKTGECYNGYIVTADYFMNFKLRDVTITAADGERFFHVDECFVRGNNVKYVRVSEEAVEKATANKLRSKRAQPNFRGRIRGLPRKSR